FDALVLLRAGASVRELTAGARAVGRRAGWAAWGGSGAARVGRLGGVSLSESRRRTRDREGGRRRLPGVRPACHGSLAALWPQSLRIRATKRDHLHLVVELETGRALSRAMQGLGIRLAKRLNGALRRRGRVFGDRYHEVVLDSPRKVRNA